MNESDPAVGQLQSVLAEVGTPWVADETEVSELPVEEKRLRLGYEPGPGEPSLAEQEQAALAAPDEPAEEIGAPAAYNLRDVGGESYVDPVVNQAGCGACIAFGTIAAMEGTARVAAGDPNMNVDHSEAHLFYCIARSQGRRCTNGWWVPPALDALRDTGVADEPCYPYVAGDQDCSDRCSDWASRVTKIQGWHELTARASMKEWISTRGPLVATMAVYSDFYSYRTGVYRHVAGDFVGGHCVCAVGYDDAAGCWICKNSWGTNWGDAGFGRIEYGQVAIDTSMWAIDGIVDRVRPTPAQTTRVTGVWASVEERNAWVYLEGRGWRRIARGSNASFLALLADLLAAKAAGRAVRVVEEGGVVTEVYVL